MADVAATVSHSEETAQAKNSPRISSSSQENSEKPKKKRGRPRFEIHDGSAADRRRTQIREAQRAYRQRKESTLDELRSRIFELTDVIDLMNKAFVECCDRLTASGLSAKSMQDIQETSARFRALKKSVRTPDEQPDMEKVGSLDRISPISAADADGNVAKRTRSVPLDVAIMDAVYAGITNEDVPVDGANFDQHSQSLTSSESHGQSFLDTVSSIPPSIEPPATYNFQETTFGRRLHRSCMEQSYQLILGPDRKPAMYQQVFELALLRRDRSNLTSALKSTLSKGCHESLHTSLPLIHIGGAGTHYPMRDSYGNLCPKREAHNLGKVGPQMLALLEQAARQNLTTDMTVDLLGYEGEWLDSYDVEGYLNEKGIFIDPASSFAEVEVPLPHQASSTVSSTDNRLSDASTDSFVDFFEPTLGFEQGSGTKDLQGSSDDGLMTSQERKTTIIDVTRFVSLLTASRVCLGWCPGFKRRDIDRALAMSSLDTI